MVSERSADLVEFLFGVRRGLRAAAGTALTPLLKRWRNTRSGSDAAPLLDSGAERFLIRYGWLDAGDAAEDRRGRYQDIVVRMARETGEAPGVIGACLGAFASGAYGVSSGGICGDDPRCAECPLSAGCRFLALSAREERLSGEALERGLLREEKKPAAEPRAAELLAFLISERPVGARVLARAEALLKALGGLRGALEAKKDQLRAFNLDRASTARLLALGELAELWSREAEPRGKVFSQGQDFYDYFHLRMRALKKERFYVLCLDQKHRLLGEELVSQGTLTEALVHPREVFVPAIKLSAAAIALIHNHPSGDPAPSRQDKQITQRLEEAADLVGIRLLDHVIVGDGKYVSFVEKGLL